MSDATWCHRVMNCPSENGGDDYFCFVEVHYKDDEPIGYTNAFMCGDTPEELHELLDRLTRALDKPVLHEDTFGDDNGVT